MEEFKVFIQGAFSIGLAGFPDEGLLKITYNGQTVTLHPSKSSQEWYSRFLGLVKEGVVKKGSAELVTAPVEGIESIYATVKDLSGYPGGGGVSVTN